MDKDIKSITYVSRISSVELYNERIKYSLKQELSHILNKYGDKLLELVNEAEATNDYQWLEMFMYYHGISEVHKCTKANGVLDKHGVLVVVEASNIKISDYYWEK